MNQKLTSTQILSEFSGQAAFTTDELHFADDPLIAIWLKEVIISAITAFSAESESRGQ
jgi:hypothetical protein